MRISEIIGIVFWVFLAVIIAVVVVYKEDRAEVLLDVSTQPELVSGTVTFAGAPAHGGVVHVVVSDARDKRYLAGVTLPISDDGKFTSQGQSALGIAKNNSRSLRLSAVFHGTLGKNKKGNSEKPLSGESTLYLNCPPPLGESFLWFVAITAAVLLVFQLVLFTGDLGQRKARWLFVVMYFFTFFSLVLPIAVSLVVAQNQYLVDSMENSPIGLVKAKTKALSEPQWLLNIGGTVVREGKPAPAGKPNDEAGNKTKAAAEVEAGNSPLGAASADSDQPAKFVEEGKPVTTTVMPAPTGEPTDEAGNKTSDAAGTEAGNSLLVATSADSGQPAKFVEGGVAVPFYVILLAMFGAGINMTLKVPEIQRSYEEVLSEARSSPLLNPVGAAWRLFRGQAEAPAFIHRKTAGDIRRELIENYMYLLSAPLLAVAMYYLLQVLAEQVTQSVLVLMAFATGLISKAVIGGIIDFAETKLLSEKRRKGEPSSFQPSAEAVAKAKEAEEAKARQVEVEEAAKALDKDKARQATAEVAEKSSQEVVDKVIVTQAKADTAKEEAETAAQEAESKQAEARETDNAVQEAEAKQADAKTAVKEAEEAAKVSTEKQAEAETAAQEAKAKEAEDEDTAKATREATPPRPEAAMDPTK